MLSIVISLQKGWRSVQTSDMDMNSHNLCDEARRFMTLLVENLHGEEFFSFPVHAMDHIESKSLPPEDLKTLISNAKHDT